MVSRACPWARLAGSASDEQREQGEEWSLPRPASAYLDEWAGDDKAWLRKYYPQGSDEPHFDLTPASEQAVEFIAALGERQLVSTESRLLTIFELLRQLTEGTTADAGARIAELEGGGQRSTQRTSVA